MKNNRNLFLLIIGIVVIALAGYYILGGNLTVSADDAKSSGIAGVQKASKYKSENATDEINLEGAEVQQLLQNDEFQELMKDESFKELMKSQKHPGVQDVLN